MKSWSLSAKLDFHQSRFGAENQGFSTPALCFQVSYCDHQRLTYLKSNKLPNGFILAAAATVLYELRFIWGNGPYAELPVSL